MAAVWIVPAFDLFKDRHAGLSLGTEYAAVNELAFEGSEKALRHRVVKAVAYRSHGRGDAHLSAAFAEGVRRVLAALIAVMDDAATTPCSALRAPARYAGDWPSTGPHLPAEGVVDDRQKHESGPGRHVGDIGHPEAVGRIGFEPAPHEVRCWTKLGVAARGACCLAPRYPGQGHLSHQPGDALATDLDTVSGEFSVNARRPIGAAALVMDVADAGLEESIVLLSRRQVTASP